MAAVITGNHLGLIDNPLAPRGDASLGRTGQSDAVYLNGATGNLVIQARDELLTALGPDVGLVRTYNSQGQFSDDNGDNWRLGVQQRLFGLTGTVNTAGSTVTKEFGDGAEIVYRFDAAQGLYVSHAGTGADDTLGYDAATQQWTWTEGTTRHAETYDNGGRIIASQDSDGNTASYGYDASGLLTSITDASGQTTYLDYNGTDLSQIRVVSAGQTQTLTRYAYDADNRLSQVIVDLSPEDNDIGDGRAYTTTYTYDGASKRVASITQGDGSSVSFIYDAQGRVNSFTDGAGKVTTLSYTATAATANNAVLSTTETQTNTVTVAPYYTVQSTDTWVSITQTVYGTSDANAVSALQSAIGNPTLTTNLHLTVPATLTYTASGSTSTTATANSTVLSTTETVDQTYSLDTAALTTPAGGTVSYLQGNYATPSSPTSSVSVTFTDAQAAGSLNVIAIAFHDSTDAITSVTDSVGNVYTLAVGPTTSDGNATAAIYYAKNIAAAAAGTNTVTVVFNTAVPSPDIRIAEYAGIDPDNPLDVATGASGVGTAMSSGAVTTTNADDLLVGTTYVQSYTIAPGTDYTQRLLTSDQSLLEDRTVTATGSYDATALHNVDGWWVMQLAAFKAASTGVPYYTVQAGDTWQSIANTLYGVNSAEAGSALQSALGDPALTAGAQLAGLPATLTVTTSQTVAPYYVVQAGDTWASITQTIYGTSDANAVSALQTATGNPTLTTDLHLTVPSTLTYTPSTSTTATANSTALSTTETVDQTYSLNTAALTTPAGGTVSYLQGNYATSSSPTDTVNVTFNNAQAAGSLNVIAIAFNESVDSIVSVTDSAGNIYALAVGPTTSDGNATTAIYYASNIVAAGANTVTVQFSAAVPHPDIRIAEYAGIDPTSPLDVATGASGVGTAMSSGAVTTTNANDLLVGTTYVQSYTIAPGTDYTQRLLTSSQNILEDRTVTATGSYDATALHNVDGWWVMQLAAFKAASTGVPYYTVQSGDTWQSIANTLYGVDSPEAGSALQTALGDPTLTAGAQLTGLPATLTVTTTQTVAPYYIVQSTDTWATITQTVYGTSDPNAVSALQTATGNPTLTTALHLTVPATLTYTASGGASTTVSADGSVLSDTETQTTTVTVAPYYTVQSGDTWDTITQTVYGTNDANAVSALQAALGNPALTAGAHLTVPQTLSYSSGTATAAQTDITDPLGTVTRYRTNADGRLEDVIVDPRDAATNPNGLDLHTVYAYDGEGNVTQVSDPRGNTTVMQYDAADNLTLTRDSLGNTVTRTYTAANQLQTETTYRLPDPDGAGPGAPSNPLTTRYVYDAEDHLRFTVSAAGRVSEYRYAGNGNRTSALVYTGGLYPLTGLTPGDVPGETDLSTWAGAQDVTHLERTDYTYDFRGNLSTTATYTSTDAGGAGIADGSESVTQFIYDPRGRLLQTLDPRGSGTTPDATHADLPYATTLTYDGLGRIVSTTQWVGSGATRTTLNTYDDANRTTTVTLANGLTTTKTYDPRGVLLSVSQADPGQALGTTNYRYDSAGRVRVMVDPLGNTTDYLYDAAGRQVGLIDATGALTETVYDADGNVTDTLRYATPVDPTARAALRDAGGNPIDGATLAAVRPTPSANDRHTYNVYDSANRLTYTIDPHDTDPTQGYVRAMRYDGAGRVIETIQYASPITVPATRTLASVAAAISLDTANDRHSRNFYDNDGHLTGTLDAEGDLCEYDYDAAGQRTQTLHYASPTDSALRATGSFEDLKQSVLNQGANPNDQHTYTFYDGKGQIIATLDAEGYLTESQYDQAGNRTQQVRYATKANPYTGSETPAQLRPGAAANDRVTVTEYDGANAITQVTTNPQGTVTRYTYDDLGHLIETDKAWNTADVRTTQARYDSRGDVLQELTGEGSAALAALGANPTQTQIDTVWDAYSVKHTYDLAGRRTTSTDQNGLTTRFYYDADGRLRFTVNADGDVRETDYDAFGQITDTIAYSGRISTTGLTGGAVTTDLLTRLSAIASPSGDNADTHTHTDYTVRGAVQDTIDGYASGLDSTISYTYNAFGDTATQTTALTASATRTDNYTYDRRGQLTQTVEDQGGLNRTTTQTLDAFGRVIETRDGNGVVRQYQYDRLGREVATTLDPTGLNLATATTYDAFARTLKQTDARGNDTSYSYDDANRRFTLTTAEGIQTITTQNRHGERVSIEVKEADGTSRTLTTYQYDRNGNLTSETDGAGSLNLTTTHTYDRANRQLLTQDANGTYTKYAYDAANRLLTRTVDPTTITSANDNPNGLNLATSYTYDSQGRTLTVTEGAGTSAARVTQTTYDAKGQVTEVAVDPNGLNLRTTYTFDKAGRTLTQTKGAGAPEARTDQYQYDPLGRRTLHIKDAGGLDSRCVYVYDANDNLIQKTEAEGTSDARTTRYAYDDANRQVFTIDALGFVTESVYDKNANVIATVQYGIALDGAVIGQIDATPSQSLTLIRNNLVTAGVEERATLHVYDRDNRERYMIDAGGYVSETRYDAAGRVTDVISYATALDVPAVLQQAGYTPTQIQAMTADQIRAALTDVLDVNTITAGITPAPTSDRLTHNTYDASGRLTSTTDPAGVVTQYYYETDASKATRIIEGAGTAQARETRRTYDRGGRLIEETIAYGQPEAITQRFEYDALGNQVALIDPRGVELAEGNSAWAQAERVRLGYLANADVLVASERQTLMARYTSHQAFDKAGRKISATDALGNTTQTVYDARGNIVKAVDPRGYAGYFYYDAHDKIRYQIDPMGYVTAYDHDAFGNVKEEIRYTNPITGTYDEHTALDDIGQRLAGIADSANDRRTTKTYDKRDLATDVVYYNNGGVNYTEHFDYDAFGDKIEYHDKNGAIYNYEYDPRGLLTKEISPAVDVVTAVVPEVVTQTVRLTNVYEYDAFGNRTVTHEAVGLFPQERQTTVTYDALNRETRIEAPAFDVFDVATRTTSTQTPVTLKTYDARGNLVEEVGPNNSVTLNYYDALDHKVASVDPDHVLHEYEYDAVGNLIHERTYETRLAGTSTWQVRPAPLDPDQYREMRYRYNANNLRVTSEAGVETLYSFDRQDTTGNGYYAGSPITATDYDANGNVVRTIEGLAFEAGTGALVTAGHATYQYYDAKGDKILQVDPLGYAIRWEYTSEGDVKRETHYANALPAATLAGITTGSDPQALLSTLNQSASPDDRVIEYDYDRLGRKITERKVAVGYATVDAANGQLTQQTSDLEVHYEYDGNGNLTAQIQPGSQGRFDYAYDALGRRTQALDPTFNAFSSKAGLTVNTVSIRSETQFLYDAYGNLAVQTQLGNTAAENRENRFEYDSAGHRLIEVDPKGARVTYDYDINGNVARRSHQVTDVDGVTHTYRCYYTYDALDRETSRQEIEDETTASQIIRETQDTRYNAFGDIEAKGINGQFQEQYKYDHLGRLFWTNKENGTPRVYAYDASGNAVIEIHAIDTDLTTVNGTPVTSASQISPLDAQFTVSHYDARNQLVETIQPPMEYGTLLSTPPTLTATGDQGFPAESLSDLAQYQPGTLGTPQQNNQPTNSDAPITVSDPPPVISYGFGQIPNDVHTTEQLSIAPQDVGLQAGTTTQVLAPVYGPSDTQISADGMTKTVTESVTKKTIVTDISGQPDGSVNRKVTTTTDIINRVTTFEKSVTQTFGENEQSLDTEWRLKKTEDIDVDRKVVVANDNFVRERKYDAVATYVGTDTQTPPPGVLNFSLNSSATITNTTPPNNWGQTWTLTVPFFAGYGDGPFLVEARDSGGLSFSGEVFGPGSISFSGLPLSIPTTVSISKAGVLLASFVAPGGSQTINFPGAASIRGQDAAATTADFRLLNDDGTPATGFVSQTFTDYQSGSGKEAVFEGSYVDGQRYEYIVYDANNKVLNHVQGHFGGDHLNQYMVTSDEITTDTVTHSGGDDTYHSSVSNTASPVQNNYLQNLALVITQDAVDNHVIDRRQSYNAFGEVQYEIDGLDHRTDFKYDAVGNLIEKIDPETDIQPEEGASFRAHPTTRYYYDELGQLVGTQDPNSVLAAQPYYNTRVLVNGRVEAEYDALGYAKRTAYDRLGNRRVETNEVGLQTEFQYDRAGRLTDVIRDDETGALYAADHYVYDAAGNRTIHTNALGATETYLFDGQGRIVRYRSFAGRETRYEYDYVSTIGAVGGYEKHTITTGLSGDDTVIDKTDYFGKIRYHKDLGAHEFTYLYNNAGWLKQQTGTSGQNIVYNYYLNGLVKSIDDTGINSSATFQYDLNGNRTLEGYSQGPISAGTQSQFPYQLETVEYDELNRVKHVFQDGVYDINYTYDANGNRRSVHTAYSNLLLPGLSQDQTYYYTYDRLNRFLVTMGSRDTADADGDGDTQEIVRGAAGFEIRYNGLGQRAEVYSDHVDPSGVVRSFREAYQYDPIGTVRYVTIYDGSTPNGSQVGHIERNNDVVGNLLDYREYEGSPGNETQVKYGHYEYDTDNVTTLEIVQAGTESTRQRTQYNYAAGTTILTSSVADTLNAHDDNQAPDSAVVTLTYDYVKWDTYKDNTVIISGAAPNVSDWQNGTSTYQYDVNGHIVELYDSQALRTIDYVNNHLGQVLKRYQIDHEPTGGDKPPVIRQFYYLNGVGIGDVGVNDSNPSLVDYVQNLADHEREMRAQARDNDGRWAPNVNGTSGSWADKVSGRLAQLSRPDPLPNRVFPVTSADFDQNYQPINATYPGRTPQSHIVQSGETLIGIAAAMWGDSSLWYLIADANGLKGDEKLVAGVRLTIPNVVTNVHNNAATFRPYDPALALGDTTPTLPDPPPPPSGGACGSFGLILIVAVAIIVPVVVPELLGIAGPGAAIIGTAAGSVASQGVAIALGYQDKFDLRAVGRAALSAGLTYGINQELGFNLTPKEVDALDPGKLALYEAEKNIVSQGANLLVGEQQQFSWGNVFAAGIAAPITREIDQRFGSVDNGIRNNYLDLAGQPARPFTWKSFGQSLEGEALKSITRQGANILTHRGGRLDWDQVASDAFGNAIGNTLAGALANASLPTQSENRGAGATGQFGDLIALDTENEAQAARAAQTADAFEAVRLKAMANFKPAGDATAPEAHYPVFGPGAVFPDLVDPPATASTAGDAEQQAVNRTAASDAAAQATQAQASSGLSLDPFTGRPFAWATPAPGPAWWNDLKETPYVGATLRTAIGLGGSYASTLSEFGSLVSDGYNYLAGNNRSVVTGEFDADSGLVRSIQSRGWLQTGADLLHGLAAAPTEFFAGIGRGDYERAGAGLGFYTTLGLGAISTEAEVAGTLGRTGNGLRTSAVVSAERAEAFLVKNGISAERASSYVNSFDGPITARLVRPGEDFLRYTDSPTSTGSFLTKTEFPSSSAAVRGLHLEAYGNNATYLQTATSSGRTIVLEGAINNGANGVRQTFTMNRSAFTFSQGKTYP